ncbi:MAG: hypothetical protein AAFO94_20160, partial [Bacteroidota bacterium]
MFETNEFRLDLDRVLVGLFCCFGFALPFELILEIWFDIETIFKPFRIVMLVIIAVFGIKVFVQGIQLDFNERPDFFLYGIFVYGLLISCWRIISGVFDMRLFINDSFQFSLLVVGYFIYKSTRISMKQAFTIFKWFVAGAILNALYIFYISVLSGISGRQAGFTDNPNYVAFGLVAVCAWFLLKTNFIRYQFRLLGIVS